MMTMTPVGAAAALCQLLLIGMVLETRLTLDAAVRDQPGGARRALLHNDDGPPPFVPADDSRMEACATAAEVERLRATVQAQLEEHAGAIAELRERGLEVTAELGTLSMRDGNDDPREPPPTGAQPIRRRRPG